MKIRFFITLALVVGMVGGIFAGYFYLWEYEVSPLIDRFFQTKVNIQALNDEDEVFRKKIEPDLEKNAEYIKEIRSLFFKPEPVLDYIIFIETLAKRNNLVHTIGTAPTASNVTSQITVTGLYRDIIRFLREVENDKILIHVQSLALQSGGVNVSANISIKMQSL
ncbi:MAG: hypothetical protein AAB372_04005 [Patescibacteria group bacterium]